MHIQVKQSCNVLSKPVILLSNTCRIIVPAGGQRVGGCTPLECGGWHDGTFAIDIACVSNVFFTKKTTSLDICLLPDLLKCVLLWESGICSEQSGGENDLLLAMDMAKVAGPLSVVKSTPYCL
jgi:hypothetical protein